MSQVEILRHAIDAARAGNPELARVHLQKAAEIVPDLPAVRLWPRWRSDPPVGMSQCLELVRRHVGYREIAGAGPAFARGLARFDCDALLPEVPASECHSIDAASSASDVVEPADDDEAEVPAADEIAAEKASAEPTGDPETANETAEASTIHESDSAEDSLSAGDFEEPALEPAEDEAFAEQPPIEATASEETAAQDGQENPNEETVSSHWDGIALLSRTAEAVADELKADSEADVVEATQAFLEPNFTGEAEDDEAASEVENSHSADETVGDQEAPASESEPVQPDLLAFLDSDGDEDRSESAVTDEGNSWFDYWLPEDERASETTLPDDGVPDQILDVTEAVTTETLPVIEGAEVAQPQEDSIVNEEVAERRKPSGPGASDDPAETQEAASADDVETRAAVLEIVEGNPFEESAGDADDPMFESTAESEGPEKSETANTEPESQTSGGYVPPVAQTVFDIPVAMQGDAAPLPPDSASGDNRDEPEPVAGWTAPTPVQQPDDVWRAAQSDWFSVGHKQDPDALIPHSTVPSEIIEPPAAGTPPASDVYSQQSALPATHGQPEVRTANQSIFDAEPTPPAIIPQHEPLALDAVSYTQPKTGLTHVESASQNAGPEQGSPETGLGRPLAEEQPQTDDTQNQPQSNGPRPQPARIKSSDTRTVLVVDDSPTVRKLVEMSLERNGFRVVHAFDGVAAIKEIARQNPSLILMDVNMPRLDGYQLCKLVKKHETTRHIPVVMLISKEGVFDKLKGRLVGCSGYIAKPFSPEELVVAVEQFLAEPATL